jgi:hypothetical protein
LLASVVSGNLWAGTGEPVNQLTPFATDGCSLWLDGTYAQPNLWRHCCVAHDLAYWLGGTQAQRKAADQAIEVCVAKAQGPGMADYIYTNVRWGGSPYWMTSYRWGFGWPYWQAMKPRGYAEPSLDEQRQAALLLPAAKVLIAADALARPASQSRAPLLGAALSSTSASACSASSASVSP